MIPDNLKRVVYNCARLARVDVAGQPDAPEQEKSSMRIKLAISCAAISPLLLSVAFPRSSEAQVNLQVQIGAPTIRFETAPVLVEVSPGIQVVPEYEQEVFFVDGWYWHRAGRTWYHTRDHRGGWVVAHGREVPRGLLRIPPGRYRHYSAARGPNFNEHRREMPGHRGGPRFQEREHGEHNDRGRFDRSNHSEHQERREHKAESHHGHR